MRGIKYQIAKKIEIGGRDYQQDFAGLVDTPNGSIILVADGMGGHKGGEIASELAIRFTIDNFKQISTADPSLMVKDSILKAHLNILRIAQENPTLSGMGTTIAVLYLSENYAQAFHVGDSRIYWIRQGQILYRSDDDTAVYKKYLDHQLTLEEARTHPTNNRLEQALGTSSLLNINASPIFNYKKGDYFLLCSDGLWGSIKEDHIATTIDTDTSLDNITNQLVNLANNAGIISGGKHDNITSILIRTMYNSKYIQKTKLKGMLFNLVAMLLLASISLILYKNQIAKIILQKNTIDSLNNIIYENSLIPNVDTASIIKDYIKVQESIESKSSSSNKTIKENPPKIKPSNKNNNKLESIEEKLPNNSTEKHKIK